MIPGTDSLNQYIASKEKTYLYIHYPYKEFLKMIGN